MNKAFDAVFQTEVDAEVIAKTAYHTWGTRFRYQCLCCGEEVYLAAADSTVKAPHFRHKRGNNDTNCERYLGQPGAVEHFVSVRKRNKEHIGFCFNIENKTFEMALLYTLEEIEKCALNKSSLSLHTKYYSQPFFTLPINSENLIPDIGNYFTLNEYSNDYYVSSTDSNKKTIYTDIIKRDCKLNIYRIKQSDCHCKRNISDILYTNYNYLAISENGDNIRELSNLQSIETDGETFSFITQEREFYAVKFVIRFIDYPSRMYFQNHELKVENSETMTILWPPVFKKDSVSVCTTETVYISSSFELIPHGNIDSNEIHIQSLSKDVCEVSFTERLTICEKNVASRIIKEKRAVGKIAYEVPQITYAEKYIVPENYDYYLFDQNGCSKLTTGAKIYLSGTDCIIGYKNGHVKTYVLAMPTEICDKKLLINDIIKYHPQLDPFKPDDFMNIEADEIILEYLENCYRTGQINTVVKRYIKEGLI